MFYVGRFPFAVPLEGVIGLSSHEVVGFESPAGDELGWTNFRGRRYPALDLERKWKIGPCSGKGRILVVVSTQYCTLGLLASRIGEICEIADKECIRYPAVLKGENSKAFHSLYPMDEDLVVILERDRLMTIEAVRTAERWSTSSVQ